MLELDRKARPSNPYYGSCVPGCLRPYPRDFGEFGWIWDVLVFGVFGIWPFWKLGRIQLQDRTARPARAAPQGPKEVVAIRVSDSPIWLYQGARMGASQTDV